MIAYERFELENGLRVIHHYEPGSAMCVLNTLYNVGARDEEPHKTGFAHLFEHLMFGGSANIPNFDGELQLAGGVNNAFTSNDITNYYNVLPVCNAETAFWLESDRMLQLDFSQKSLDVQKSVVIEEFKQRYLNQPYGNVWHLIRETAYTKHPYSWPTIGKEIKHIEDADLDYVKQFFNKYYNPSNAILCVSGGLNLEDTKKLVQKWFDPIPAGPINTNNYPKEPEQTEMRRISTTEKVPQDALYICFKMCDRLSPDYYATDVISDLLGQSESSYLHTELVKNQNIFTTISAYVLGSINEGLLVISGMPAKGVSLQEAEDKIWEKLDFFKSQFIDESKINRAINKIKTAHGFSMLDSLEKAMSLCFSENYGNIEMTNTTLSDYEKVHMNQVKELTQNILKKEKSTVLHYQAEQDDIK